MVSAVWASMRRMAAHGIDDGGDQRDVLGQYGGRGRDRQPVEMAMR